MKLMKQYTDNIILLFSIFTFSIYACLEMDDGRGGGLFWLNRKQLVVLPSYLILFLCIWFSAEGMINYNLRLTLFTRLKLYFITRMV